MTAPLIALTVLAGLGAIGLLVAILAGAFYVGYLQHCAEDERARTRVDVTTVPVGAIERMRQHPGPSPEFRAAIDRAAERRNRR